MGEKLRKRDGSQTLTRRFPFQRIHFKLPTFQTETCSGGINISILAACLSGQQMVCRVVPRIQSKTSGVPKICPNRTYNPLPLCNYSFIVQYCRNITRLLPFIEQDKNVQFLILMHMYEHHEIYFICDSQKHFPFDLNVQKGL